MLWNGKNESRYVCKLLIGQTQYINNCFRYNSSTSRFSINFAIEEMVPNACPVHNDGKTYAKTVSDLSAFDPKSLCCCTNKSTSYETLFYTTPPWFSISRRFERKQYMTCRLKGHRCRPRGTNGHKGRHHCTPPMNVGPEGVFHFIRWRQPNQSRIFWTARVSTLKHTHTTRIVYVMLGLVPRMLFWKISFMRTFIKTKKMLENEKLQFGVIKNI